MDKSLSQRISRFLEIINYILLVPSTLIEIISVALGLVALFRGEPIGLSLILLVSIIYFAGNLLLYGYYKHSRGLTTKTSAIFLWIGTIGFNLIPIVMMILLLPEDAFNISRPNEIWFYNIFGCYISVILLAVAAFINDLLREFDYTNLKGHKRTFRTKSDYDWL